METAVYIVVILIMVAGVAGTILPVIPGIPIIFLAAAGYGWYEGFRQVTGYYLAVLGILAVLSAVVDYVAGAYGTRYFGASRYGTWGSIIGGLIGIFTMGPIGILVGPWLGAVVGEILAQKTLNDALRAGTGALVGMLSGMMVKLLMAIGMLISFIVVTLPIV
ncbi:MAG: DUF456 domain-containing protein [Methylocystaceae bacterium]